MPLDDGNASPPPGWGNPYDAGSIQVDTETTATYTGDTGMSVAFVRTDRGDVPFAGE